MTKSVIPFDFHDHNVRVLMRDDAPWFVAADVATALGYQHTPNAMRILNAQQQADVHIVNTSFDGTKQNRRVTIINESGLYRLVLRSRKPAAVAFSDWVTGTVLPSIRRTGGYGGPTALPAPAPAPLPTAHAARDALTEAWSEALLIGHEVVQAHALHPNATHYLVHCPPGHQPRVQVLFGADEEDEA